MNQSEEEILSSKIKVITVSDWSEKEQCYMPVVVGLSDKGLEMDISERDKARDALRDKNRDDENEVVFINANKVNINRAVEEFAKRLKEEILFRVSLPTADVVIQAIDKVIEEMKNE